MKSKRHEKILEIIAKKDIETQDELTECLRAEGFDVTQATVSRDIKALRLVKTTTGGRDGENRYKYTVNGAAEDNSVGLGSKFKSILGHSIIKVDNAGNLVVIKTYAGMANASAAALDSMNIPDVLGTIAGDDTILIVMKKEEEASELVGLIEGFTK